MRTIRPWHLSVLFLPAAAWAGVAACSDSTDPAADAGTDTSPGDGSKPDSAPTDAGFDAGRQLVKSAQVFVTQPAIPDAGGYRSVFAANFFRGKCTTTTSGACVAQVCDTAMTPNNVGQGEVGDITFHSTAIDSQLDGGLTIRPVPDAGNYPRQMFLIQSYSPGDKVTASAAGGSVPGFASQSVTAASDIVVTAPIATAGSAATFPRSSPLTVRWTGGTAGKVRVSLLVATAPGSVKVSCDFDATAHTGQVPTEMLSKLPPPGSPVGDLAVLPIGATTFSAGDTTVEFAAMSAGLGSGFKVSD